MHDAIQKKTLDNITVVVITFESLRDKFFPPKAVTKVVNVAKAA